MKTALIILAAIFLISASTITVFTPALPKATRHKLFTRKQQGGDIFEIADKYIGQCIRDGYVIKTVAICNAGSYAMDETVIVIAEKY